MGIQGLTSFLEQKYPHLGKTISFSTDSNGEAATVVVDGLAFTYTIYLESQEMRYGGEYSEYYELIQEIVTTWRRCNLNPIFVFDGPFPSDKYMTVLGRIQQGVTAAVRACIERSWEAKLLPPLIIRATRDALIDAQVEVIDVEEEADQWVASIARKREAFVCSNDSDFYIFDVPKGYLPLKNWIYRTHGCGIDYSQLDVLGLQHCNSFKVKVIHQTDVASLLSLPKTLLPLLASLVGNDYFCATNAELGLGDTFDSGRHARINAVATVLSRVSKSKAYSQSDSETARRVLELLTPKREEDLRDETLTKLIDSVTKYDTMHLSDDEARGDPSTHNRTSGPFLGNLCKSGIFIERQFLENVAFSSPVITVGRPLRLWLYAILDANGTLVTPNPEMIDSIPSDVFPLRGDLTKERSIVEHVRRRGRLSREAISFPSLPYFVPGLLSPGQKPSDQSVEVRLSIFLRVMGGKRFGNSNQPAPFSPLMVCLRYLAHVQNWDRPKLRAAAMMVCLSQRDYLPREIERWHAFPTHEGVQATAELLACFGMVDLLVIALSLESEILSSHKFFHGRLFHYCLSKRGGEDFTLALSQEEKSLISEVLSFCPRLDDKEEHSRTEKSKAVKEPALPQPKRKYPGSRLFRGLGEVTL